MNNRHGDGLNSEQKLYAVIQQELEKKEFYNRMRAELRAEVVKLIRFGDKSPMNDAPSNSLKSPSNMLNHLIMEYFDWMNLYYSSSMLSSEAGIIKRANRSAIEQNLKEDNGFDKELPVLFDMLMRFLKDN